MTLPKTEKLYQDDPYAVDFQAEIISCEPDKETGKFAVVLDRSCFFPESGGQLADRGNISDLTVVDVRECAGGVIKHFLENEPAGAGRPGGSAADCRVDWNTRFDHMQQHTGQHVLTRAFIEVAGLTTESFHMGDEACTIDLEGRDFDEDIVARAEDLANAVVCENRPVRVRNVTPADLKDLELRRALPDGVTDVRLIDVENFDVIPCCGTHVKRTGELGLIKVLRHENIKGIRRVYFKVGGRAYKDYVDKHTIVQHLANRFTTSADGINAKVDKLSAQLQNSKKDLKRLSKQLAAYEIADLVESAGDCNGKKLIVRFFPDGDDGYLRMLSSGLKAEPNVVVILGAGNGAVVCSASDGAEVDFSLSAVPMANAVGGSGGGKGSFAQLKLPAGVDVKEFLIKVGDNVQKTLS